MRVGLFLLWVFTVVFLGFIPTLSAQSAFSYAMPDSTVVYDPDDVAGTFTVDVSISEDPVASGYDVWVLGFFVAVASDADYVRPVGATATGDVAALYGGLGPDYFGFTTKEDSLWVIMVVDLDYSFTTDLFLDGLALSLEYELNPDTLRGDKDGAVTELTFEDFLDPGDDFSNLVNIFPGLPLGPAVLDNAAITLSPKVVEPPVPHDPLFRRGDADGNGVVSAIPDAIYLLKYGFTSGAAPACVDAADVDDNGSVTAIPDAIALLRWSFTGGVAPADPGPETCGADTTDDGLACETAPAACAP